jgi:hypothetical protein
LQLGEENNIRVSPSLIENAFRAELAGDEGKAFNVLKSIEQEVQKGRDMQAEEEKENVTLADGSQISRGKKSGTLYRNGVPVSQGAINTGTYNKVVESITDLFTVAKLSGYTLEISKLYRDISEKKHTCHLHIDLSKDNEKHFIRLYVKSNELVKMFYVGKEKVEWYSHFEDFLGATVEDDRGKITIHAVYIDHMVSLFYLIKGYI